MTQNKIWGGGEEKEYVYEYCTILLKRYCSHLSTGATVYDVENIRTYEMKSES